VVAVDPDDDTVRRYVVRHYRYDPDRHERRHVVVAAFDNESEWDACLGAAEAALRARRDAGEVVDPREHVSGAVYARGYRRLQQNGRLVRRAAEHLSLVATPHSHAEGHSPSQPRPLGT
jgi:hypothetical protein